jgi:hypothetical protein
MLYNLEPDDQYNDKLVTKLPDIDKALPKCLPGTAPCKTRA